MPQKFYLTTPIYYVNARPHIGHAYTTIAADVLARRHRLVGDDVFFLTGTDEHGQKIERSAAAAGIPPEEFAKQVAGQFRALWDRMGITYSDFIRTSDRENPRHVKGVQKLFDELFRQGFIYLDSYTGAYCVSDEAFVDVAPGEPCPDCGRVTEALTEANFFFKLSSFQRPLLDLIESRTFRIENESRRNEVLSFLAGPVAKLKEEGFILVPTKFAIARDLDRSSTVGEFVRVTEPEFTAKGTPYVPGALRDISVSRSSFTWGIPVPPAAAEIAREQAHIVYVWLDALANYITAIGYGADDAKSEAKFKHYWPADIHLVGKEIIRFHCVYWPAFLLALNPQLALKDAMKMQDKGAFARSSDLTNVPPEIHKTWAEDWLPKAVIAHGWLLFEESKMSKSRGNIVRTETILDTFGNLVYASAFPTSSHTDQDLFAADVLRHFLLREIPFGQDGSFSFDALITRYNADLANGYGNLVSRTLTMIDRYCDGAVPRGSDPPSEDAIKQFEALARTFGELLETCEFSKALEKVWIYIAILDKQITAAAPWKSGALWQTLFMALPADKQSDPKIQAALPWNGGSVADLRRVLNLASEDGNDLVATTERLANLLYDAAEAIRFFTALLRPVMPHTTAKVWAQLGLGDIEAAARSGELKDLKWGGLKPGTKLGPLAPIFPRAPKELAQVMSDIESQSNPPKAAEPTPAPATPAAAIYPADAAAPSTQSPAPGASPLISIDDFAKVDLRVARVLVAERIPKADKLLRLEVDLGPTFDPPTRQILAGIAQFYEPEKLIGRKVVIVANLAPRKMRGLESQGMVVAASIEPDGAPVLASFLEDVEIGARLK